MTKLRLFCASILLLLGLAGCTTGGSSSDPTSVAPLASPAASGVTNPASPNAGSGTGYSAPSQAPAAAPAITADPSYPGPSAAP